MIDEQTPGNQRTEIEMPDVRAANTGSKKSEWSFSSMRKKFSRWRECRREKWKDTPVHERETLRLTRVIAVSTVCYTLVAAWTLHEIHSGSADTRKLAEMAHLQWKELNATRQYARESLMLQNRPWVGIVNNTLTVKELEPMRQWRVSYKVKNYGRSPARRVIHSASIKVGDMPSWTGHVCDQLDKDYVSDSREPATVIFPETEFMFSDATVSTALVSPLGKRWLAVQIAYHDIWGPDSKGCVALLYSLDDRAVVGAESY